MEDIRYMDIKYDQELGYYIKQGGISRKSNESIECMAHSVLVTKSNIF